MSSARRWWPRSGPGRETACLKIPKDVDSDRAVLRTAEPHIADARQQAGYVAALAEANGAEEGPAVLDAIDQDAVSGYQSRWAVRAHLLQPLGKKDPEAQTRLRPSDQIG